MPNKYLRQASDSVINESAVTGVTVSDALDTLQSAISAEDIWDKTGTLVSLKVATDTVLLGTGTSYGRQNQKLEVNNNLNTDYGGLALNTWSTLDRSPLLDFNVSGSNTKGNYSIVADDREYGNIIFRGANGASFIDGVGIVAYVDDVPSLTSMPGRLVFKTTPAGSTTLVDRQRISNEGFFGFRTASNPVTYYHFMVDGASGVLPGAEQFWLENNNVLNMGFAFSTGANFQMNIYENAGEQWQLLFDGSSNEFRMFNGTIGQFFVQRSTEVVINEAGASINFRVESDTDTELFFAQGSTNRIGISTTAPNSTLHVDGSASYAYRATAIGVTLNETDSIINCTAAPITISLPTAVGITGRRYIIKNTAGAGNVTIDPAGAELIDGAATVMVTNGNSRTIVSTNVGWIIV